MQIKELKSDKPVEEEDTKALRQAVEKIIERVRKEGDAALSFFPEILTTMRGRFRLEKRRLRLPKEICRTISSRALITLLSR